VDEQSAHATTHLTPDPVEASEAGTRREGDAARGGVGASGEDEGGRVEDGGGRRGLGALAIDLTPLRASREFRLLFAGR
jgi:hypothetical protein